MKNPEQRAWEQKFPENLRETRHWRLFEKWYADEFYLNNSALLLSFFDRMPFCIQKGIIEEFLIHAGCCIDQLGIPNSTTCNWSIWKQRVGFLAYKEPVRDAILKVFNSVDFTISTNENNEEFPEFIADHHIGI